MNRRGGAAGVKRECACPRAKHQHGTVEAYTRDACRCEPCSTAQWAKIKWYRKQVILGRWGPQWGPACGVTRRLQALEAIGYTDKVLAGYLGVNSAWVQRIVNETRPVERVRISTYRTVSDLYDDLAGKPADCYGAKGARARAQRKGWLPPTAWDEDDLDDPDAISVETDPATLSRDDRVRLAARLVEYGATQRHAAKRCGVDDEAIRKMMKATRGEAA